MRLQEAHPFTFTGIDFTGAMHVKNELGTIQKVYICLFTCASTRGVHLEVLPSLSEESFMKAFRRFTCRKSTPKVILTDNAKTFIAASNEVRKLFESQTVRGQISDLGIDWKFIPNRAPWYGGFWERLIGTTKTALKKVLGQSLVDMETLNTIVTEVEMIMNDRPLTYTSTDIDDMEPLTPSHLLYGRNMKSLPYPRTELDESTKTITLNNSSLVKRKMRLCEIIQHFWKRWKNDYLTSLREFHKASGNNKQQIQVGDIVLVHDETPRQTWKMAVVKELIRGNDGLVRAARIKTKNIDTTRPIVKLYPLEINSTNDDETEDHQQTVCVPTEIRPRRQASLKTSENIRKWTSQPSTSKD